VNRPRKRPLAGAERGTEGDAAVGAPGRSTWWLVRRVTHSVKLAQRRHTRAGNSRKSAALLKSQNLVHLDWATLLKSGFGARGRFRGPPEMAVSARPIDLVMQRPCQSLPRRSTPPRGRPRSRNSFTQNGLHLNVRLGLAGRVLATRSRKVSFWPICPEGRRSG